MSIFSSIQDYQDELVSRFCNPKRLLIAETDWYKEEEDIDLIKKDCLGKIIFFESRGFYLFQNLKLIINLTSSECVFDWYSSHLSRMLVRI